jgi:DNA-binding CsgD family transcriptional regulator
MVAAWAAVVAAWLGRPAEAERRADAVDRWDYGDAARPADPPAEAWAALLRALMARRGVEQMRADADEGARRCAAAGIVAPAAELFQGIACVLCGDLDGGDAFFEDAASQAEEVGAYETLAVALAERSLVAMSRGEWGRAEAVRLQACLADAQIRYHGGDRARGRRSLAAALRLAEAEQLRLPLVMERSWIGPVLRHDPALADAHRRLLAPALRQGQRPAPPAASDPPPIPLVVEPLTERERDVLRHFSGMLNTAEVASEMYISVNTVKTHLKSIYRKLSATHCGEAVRRARQLELI